MSPTPMSPRASNIIGYMVILAAVVGACVLEFCHREPDRVVTAPPVQYQAKMPVRAEPLHTVKRSYREAKKVDTCVPNGIDCGAICTSNGKIVECE